MAAICEKLPDNPGGPCILVDNSVEALQALARYYRDQVDVKVVGITGSVGKTSTKEVVAGVLSKNTVLIRQKVILTIQSVFHLQFFVLEIIWILLWLKWVSISLVK